MLPAKMASKTLKLVQTLKRKKISPPFPDETNPPMVLAQAEMGDGILSPSRTYMCMNICDVPFQNAEPPPQTARAQRGSTPSRENGCDNGHSTRAKRKADDSGAEQAPRRSEFRGQGDVNIAALHEAAVGQRIVQEMLDAADASTKDNAGLEPLPPPQIVPELLQQNVHGATASDTGAPAEPQQPAEPTSAPACEEGDVAMAKHVSVVGSAGVVPDAAPALKSGHAQATQHAILVNSHPTASAAAAAPSVNGPLALALLNQHLGIDSAPGSESPSGSAASGEAPRKKRQKLAVRKGSGEGSGKGKIGGGKRPKAESDPKDKANSKRATNPRASSRFQPQADAPGRARKSTGQAAAQAAAQLAEGEAQADPSEPGHAEEELQGASDQAIAAVNVEYGLTTPHEVSPEEYAAGQKRLLTYREYCAELKSQGQKKEDMRGFKDKKVELGTPLQKIGHIPGFKAGDVFRNKGELAITGIHCNIAGGIYSLQNDPVYAIVLSGGYKDDADGEKEIFYTGMGGQKGGVQVDHQDWERGNLNLKIAFQRGTPVRVCRGAKVEKTYDGLYRITRAWKEKGKDGFIICRFRLVPIPGHSHVSEMVIPKVINTRRAFRMVRDVEDDNVREKRQLNWLAKAESRPGFLIEDISKGLEKVKIPAFNDKDDTPFPGEDILQYIKNSVIRNQAARELAALGTDAYVHKQCGRKLMGNSAYVGTTSLLKKTEINCTCLYECLSTCQERQCEQNKVVTKGVSAPLEVFYTGPERAWGLRCARDIQEGEFVCEYVGELITTEEAETVNSYLNHDKYLYDLKDFSGAAIPSTDPDMRLPYKTPQVPRDAEHPEKPIMRHLTIDARTKGNMGRFMNHHCGGGNVVGRTVLTEGDSGLMFRVAMFAHSFVPAGEELTYDYQWDMKALELPCQCGHSACKGWKEGNVAAAVPPGSSD